MSEKSNKNLWLILALAAVVVVAVLLYFFVFNTSAKYDKLVTQADEQFVSNQLEDAKSLYSKALEVKPEEMYPVQRIASIDSIMKVRQKMALYNKKLNRADELFGQGKYNEAREIYLEALNLNTDDDYPVNQIKKIDNLLKEIQAKAESSVPEGNYFHIVIGVFENDKYAKSLNSELKEKNKKSVIVPRQQFGMYAVTAASFPTIHDAWNHLKLYREEYNEDAWVLYYKPD